MTRLKRLRSERIACKIILDAVTVLTGRSTAMRSY